MFADYKALGRRAQIDIYIYVGRTVGADGGRTAGGQRMAEGQACVRRFSFVCSMSIREHRSYIYRYIQIHIHKLVYIYLYMYIYIFVHICVYVCTYMYTYMRRHKER